MTTGVSCYEGKSEIKIFIKIIIFVYFGLENGEQKRCDCKLKQLEWFLFNKNLALPEYIVEFEYLNKVCTKIMDPTRYLIFLFQV